MRTLSCVLILLTGPLTLTCHANTPAGRKWPSATASFHVSIPGADNLWNDAFETAMARWTPGTPFRYTIFRGDYADPCVNNDRKNGVAFTTTNCGDDFGNALAVTLSVFSSGTLLETDIVFDKAESWNVYSGPLKPGTGTSYLHDFRRVAVHELGHALGLGHESSVPAIMHPSEGNYEIPQPDDIAGVNIIYGGTTSGPSITQFFASPAVVSPGGASQLQWTTSGAASASINQGIGGVATSGSRTVTPGATTSYTLTATDSAGVSVTSSITVTVSTGGGGTATLTSTPAVCNAGKGVVTLTWNSPGSSNLVIRVGSPTGTPMTGPLASSGSVATGDWVTNGMAFYLVDSTGRVLGSTTASVNCSGSSGLTFTAAPAVCNAGKGVVTLTWNAPGFSNLVIRVGSATGTPMTGALASSGSVQTGDWVTNGMQFFLIDSSGRALSFATASVNCTTSTVTFTASPAVCSSGAGVVTLTWNAPGRSNLVIRVGSPTGTAMTGPLGATGSGATGPWVTNGMAFYLVDSAGRVVASTTASVNCADTLGVSITAGPAVCNAGKGTVTLIWNAPGFSNLVIRVGSPTGTPMTGPLASIGSVVSGDWVTNGMPFYLIDSSGRAIAWTAASVNCGR